MVLAEHAEPVEPEWADLHVREARRGALELVEGGVERGTGEGLGHGQGPALRPSPLGQVLVHQRDRAHRGAGRGGCRAGAQLDPRATGPVGAPRHGAGSPPRSPASSLAPAWSWSRSVTNTWSGAPTGSGTSASGEGEQLGALALPVEAADPVPDRLSPGAGADPARLREEVSERDGAWPGLRTHERHADHMPAGHRGDQVRPAALPRVEEPGPVRPEVDPHLRHRGDRLRQRLLVLRRETGGPHLRPVPPGELALQEWRPPPGSGPGWPCRRRAAAPGHPTPLSVLGWAGPPRCQPLHPPAAGRVLPAWAYGLLRRRVDPRSAGHARAAVATGPGGPVARPGTDRVARGAGKAPCAFAAQE